MKTLPALGHDWGDWYVGKEPTAEEEGYYQRECNLCREYDRVPISGVYSSNSLVHLDAYRYGDRKFDMKDVLYGRLAAATKKVVTVENDRTLFYACVKSEEELLLAEYPDDPELAAEKICALLADKCSELCYELNAAPKDRSDSYVTGWYTQTGTAQSTCSGRSFVVSAPSVQFNVTFCEEHKAIRAKLADVAALKDRQERTAAFTAVRKMWLNALNEQVAAAYKQADASLKPLIAAYRANYGSYLTGHEQLLAALYRGRSDTAAEVLMREIMMNVLDNCN